MKSVAVMSGSGGWRNGMSHHNNGFVVTARCAPEDTDQELTRYVPSYRPAHKMRYPGYNSNDIIPTCKDLLTDIDHSSSFGMDRGSSLGITPSCKDPLAEADHGSSFKHAAAPGNGNGSRAATMGQQPYATRGMCSTSQMQHNPPHSVGMLASQATPGWDAPVSQSGGMGTCLAPSSGMQSSQQQLTYSRPTIHSSPYPGSHSAHLPGTGFPAPSCCSGVQPSSAYFTSQSTRTHQYPPSFYHHHHPPHSSLPYGAPSQVHSAPAYPPASCNSSSSSSGSNLSMHYPPVAAPSWERAPYSSTSSSSVYSEHSSAPFDANSTPYAREMAAGSRHHLLQPQLFTGKYNSQPQHQRAPAQTSPYHYPPMQHASSHASSNQSLPHMHSSVPCTSSSSYPFPDPYHPPAHTSTDPYRPALNSSHPYQMPVEPVMSHPGAFSNQSSGEVRVPPSYLPLDQGARVSSLTGLPNMQKQAPDSSGVESCGRPLNVDERANKSARERPSDVATSEFMQKVAENVSRAQSQQQHERQSQEPESPGQHIEIICHPEDTQVVEGSSVTLTCSARISESNAKPSYLWYKDEEPLIGEVGSTYTIAAITSDDLGYYFCAVSDTEGQVERKSRTACVSLVHQVSAAAERCPPFILEQPDSVMQVIAGGMLSLKLKVRAHPPPTFIWYRNGIELPFAQDEELVIPRVSTRDEGHYTCSISNELGSTLSGRFTVQLVKRPSYPELSATALEAASNSATIPDSNFTPPTYSTDPNAHKPSSPLPSPVHHFPVTGRLRSSAFCHTQPPPPPTADQDHGSACERSLGLLASQLAHSLDPSTSSRLAMELNISSEELGRIRAHNPHLEQQLLHLLMIGRERTMCRDVAQLEKLLQQKGFQVSLPHSSFSSYPMPPQREFVSAAGRSSIGPVIITHPRSVQVHAGETAMLSVEVSMADTDVTYVWYKDGMFLYDECQPHLLFQATHENDSGLYYCKVEGHFGATDSHPARLEVLPASTFFPATVTEYPSYQSSHGLTRDDPFYYDVFREPYIPRKESGDTASLPSLDSMPISHQQGYIEPAYKSRGLVSNSSSYTVPSITEQLQNSRISDVSSKQKPVIVKHPQSQELNLGDELRLSVQASGTGELKYLWHLNNISLYNECRPEFVLYCFTEDDEGNYMCEVSNDSGSVLSLIASISCKQDEESDAED